MELTWNQSWAELEMDMDELGRVKRDEMPTLDQWITSEHCWRRVNKYYSFGKWHICTNSLAMGLSPLLLNLEIMTKQGQRYKHVVKIEKIIITALVYGIWPSNSQPLLLNLRGMIYTSYPSEGQSDFSEGCHEGVARVTSWDKVWLSRAWIGSITFFFINDLQGG